MRIVIDMQGAQTESRFRGIGRYTMTFAKAVARNRGDHEIILALNGLFPESIEPIRIAFDSLLPQENIRVWSAPGPVMERIAANEYRRNRAEIMREDFLASLKPDIIHICSLFEGFVDDAVTSIGLHDQKTHVSVLLHDLIPLNNPNHFLKPNPVYAEYYQRKVAHLRKAALLLANSRHTAQDGIAKLNFASDRVVPVFAAVEDSFRRISINESLKSSLLSRCGITRKFVFYTGGCDNHKNLLRLIEAFSLLPGDIRAQHQLVFSGQMPEGNVSSLRRKAEDVGLRFDELVFTGYVDDEDLVRLYNLCASFVFPSWEEGFGMPPLEAMACGAPVIAGNRTSLPEVLGWHEATFDPFDVDALAYKLKRALVETDFREQLISRGTKHAKSFSWDSSARKALAAMTDLLQAGNPGSISSIAKPRVIDGLKHAQNLAAPKELVDLSCHLAANLQAGIERQLLLDVSELCQRDAGTGVQRVVRNHLKNLMESPPRGFRVEPVYATREHGYRYAREFARSFTGAPVTNGPDAPVEWQRGDIFFALDMQHHVQLAHRDVYRLLRAEGVTVKFMVYDLLPIQLKDLFSDSNARELHEQWLRMIASTDGAICISQATADAFRMWISDQGVETSANLSLDAVHLGADLVHANPSCGLPTDANHVLQKLGEGFTFLCVSTIEPRKRQQQVLEAFELLWERGHDVNLVLVGREGWKIHDLARKLRENPESGQRLFWLEGISDEYLDKVYSVADCTIAASLDEGFGLSLIESAIKGVDLLVRDIPVFREVAGDSAYYFEGLAAEDLASAVEAWIERKKSGAAPKAQDLNYLTWQQSSELLKEVLIERNYPRRQLLVDISELVQKDAGSGIQRVVRNILREWLKSPPDGYRVEPVYARPNEPYRYARDFSARFTKSEPSPAADSPIEYAPGDVFFGLDFQPQVVMSHKKTYQSMRLAGVRVVFVVYDLLSVRMPEHFLPGNKEGFELWLNEVSQADGAVCISKSVAEDLQLWLSEKDRLGNGHRKISVDWFHLGADMDTRDKTRKQCQLQETVINQIKGAPSFLCVGTIEPRKGIEQMLQAFEILWAQELAVNLVLVGKPGWMVADLVERLNRHPELGKRLFWLQGISDSDLEQVYDSCTCLLAASFGEGFGLPLIEAAQRELPILARDLPVFREVAGDHACYFDAETGDDLAKHLRRWLHLRKQNLVPKSQDLPFLTWRDSARSLMEKLLSSVDTQPPVTALLAFASASIL
jgi:glycosyltransferase involved in cell wall biosynthesis